jgi:hypothetical protein
MPTPWPKPPPLITSRGAAAAGAAAVSPTRRVSNEARIIPQ